MKLTITQYDASNGVRASGSVLARISVALPGSISGPTGPAGVQGIQGPQGERGPAGTGSTVTFAQAVPLASWVIAHGMGRFPSVEIVDSSGRIVEGDVRFDSADQLTVDFTAAFSGIAYLN